MTIQLDDTDKHLKFAPLTLTRPLGNLRMGILTNDERFKLVAPDHEVSYNTEEYLSSQFSSKSGLRVNASVILDRALIEAILNLDDLEALFKGDLWIAGDQNANNRLQYTGKIPVVLENRWDVFQENGAALISDFEMITKGRTSKQLSPTNTIIGDPNQIFLEEGASVEAAILNTRKGPIYIGKNAEVMEGALVRGPFAMGESAALKLGAKVYGPTTLGPHCKVGGEVNNAVFQAYSNKGHDGFLGNALIGEWCNLGADTNCSNLKNNYGSVRVYDYATEDMVQTDVQFMGLVMGDHSKCGINTMFNTATIIGVSANVFSGGFPPKYIPSFSWGVEGQRYKLEKAIESANNMMKRRGLQLSSAEIGILTHIADTE